jgi:hypothetical protein
MVTLLDQNELTSSGVVEHGAKSWNVATARDHHQITNGVRAPIGQILVASYSFEGLAGADNTLE